MPGTFIICSTFGKNPAGRKMERIIKSFYFICCFSILISCNSNSLKQDQAEKTIREFLSTNTIQTSNGIVSAQTIHKIGKTNIFSQFNTSVKVYFNNKEGGQALALLFIFTRTPDNRWFLKSVEALDGPVQELSDWLKAREKLNIAVQ